LHPSLVASASLARLECCQETISQAPAALLESLGQVFYRPIRHHDVGLGRVFASDDDCALSSQDASPPRRGTNPPTGPIEGRLSGKAGRVAPSVHQSYLPVLQHRVAAHDDAQCLFGSCALRDEVKPSFAVVGVGQALRGHGTHAGTAPGHDPAHIGKLRLDRDSQIAGEGVVGDDAVGVGELLIVRRDRRGLLGIEQGAENRKR
jgi:hypothetical protein